MAFEDILQRVISDESDRIALKTFGEKYPALRDSMLAQEDYSRKMNEVKTDLEEVGKWREWKKKAWNDPANKTHAEVMLEQQLESVRADLALKGDENVDFETIMGELDKRGVMTNAKFEEQKKDLLDRNTYREDVTGRLGNMGALYENVFASGMEKALQHQKDFGEILPMKEVLKYMGENKMNNLEDAYEKMFEPRLKDLRAKRETDHEQQIREDERKKVLQEKAQANEGRGNPVDNTGGVRPRGFLEERKLTAEKKANENPELDKIPLGSGITAQIASEEYRKNPGAFAAKNT